MIKRAALGPHKLSLPQIALIVAVGLLVVVVGGVMLRTYFSSAGTATAFEEAGFTTTNLSNIQRESLLLRIETHALFSDFTRGFEQLEYSERDFKPVELRRDFLTAQLRVAVAQASGNADALTQLDQVASTLGEYDSLLASVRANPTFDRSAAIAQSDEVLIRLERQVKALYDQQEVRFFSATGASLRAMRFSHTLLLVVGTMMLALCVVLAASLSQSVHTAFKRAYDALETEMMERRRIEDTGRRLVEEKVVVDEVARIITSTLDIEEVYERFAAEVEKLVDFDRMSISLYEPNTGMFTVKHTVGQGVSGQDVGDMVPLKGTPTQVAIDTGLTVVVSDTADDQYTTDQRFFEAGLRSMLLVPLTYRGSAIGGMAVRSTNIGAYGLRDQVILERLAHQIAPAVANAELFEQSKRAEEAMRQSEAGAKALLESASQGVVVANEDGEIVQINASALDMFGYGFDELLGQPVETLVPDSIRDIHGVQRNSYFANPVSRPMGLGLELAGRRKDGTCFPAEISLSSIATDGDTLALAFIADISERKQAEEDQRRWAEENSVMAEIGRVISSSLEIDEVYNRLGREIRKLITFDRMTISMFDQEEESISQTWVIGTEVPGRWQGERIPLAGTFAEYVIRERSPVMLEPDNESDLRERFPVLLPHFRAGMRTFLAAPLIYRDDVIGVLQLRSKERGVYSQPHLDLAERVANQIAGAIANSQLYAERKRLAEESSVMSEIGRVISSSLDIDDVYDRLGEQTGKLVPLDHMSLSLIDQENGVSCVTWVFGQEIPDRGPGDIVPLDGAFVNNVVLARSPVMLEVNTEEDLLSKIPRQLPAFRVGMRSFLGVPLFYRDDLIGVLLIQSKEQGIYSQRDLDLAERVGNQIAGAIANSQLFADRKRLAEETSVMAEIGRAASASLDINEVYDLIGETIRKVIAFDQFGMSLINYESGTSSPIWTLATDGPGRDWGKEVPLAGAFTGEVVRTRSPMLLEVETAADLEDRFPPLMPAYNLGMRSFMAVPIVVRDTVIAVLQIRSKEHGLYSQRHLDLAERVANQIAGAIANFQLYAEQVQAEEAMRVSEQKYRTLVDHSPDMIFVSRIDDFRLTEVNDRACEHYGYTRKQFLALSIFDLEVEPPVKEEVRSLYDNNPVGSVVEVYGTNKRKDGTTFPVHVRFTKLDDEVAIANVRDITQQQDAEEQIRASLAEKEVLLKEINHRVKNNLQIVSSLLNLGSRDIQDGQAQEMLDESQARIRAMALIHEKLYQSEDLARIDFGEYLRSLTSDLRKSHGFNAQDIELKVDAGHTLLGVDTAIPCGLIVNEMVSNSFKHAFPNGSGGEISIALRLEDQNYSLTVRDNGVGFPEDFDIRRSKTLGLKLVNALVDQLGGTIELNRKGGAEVNIMFPVS